MLAHQSRIWLQVGILGQRNIALSSLLIRERCPRHRRDFVGSGI